MLTVVYRQLVAAAGDDDKMVNATATVVDTDDPITDEVVKLI